MYKPVRPRPKKTEITRSRKGCKSCRERRTKCDEKRPCGTCTRLGKTCEDVKPDFKFRMVNGKHRSVSPKRGFSESQSPPETETQEITLLPQKEASLPDLSLVRSLQHTERDVFYSTYWEDICLPALHPMFNQTYYLGHTSSMLNHAMLALSSCNMSRLYAERRGSPRKHMGVYSPSLIHQTRSQLYYSLAIKEFTSVKQIDSQSSLALPVLVLFAYIESSMGNFQGFNCHVQGLANFLTNLEGQPGDATFNALLTAWMQIRFVVWWARAYFSRLDIHLNLPSVPLPKSLEGGFATMEERRASVLNIMCESHRLNSKLTLRHWSQNSGYHDDDETTSTRLIAESEELASWLWHLPMAEQPLEINIGSPDSDGSGPDVPVFFQSHDAALNFAYYVLARIMQCTGGFRRLRNICYSPGLEYDDEESRQWLRLLLNIANGTNMQTSVSKNSYTIGFSGLLLAGLLRCQDLPLGLEIQSWLEVLHSLHPTEEGAFPIYQTLGVAKMVNSQRMMGRDIYGVSQVEDDGGGFPKFTAYNSQTISSLLLHGVHRDSGALFTECVSIDV